MAREVLRKGNYGTMLKSLARLLKRAFGGAPRTGVASLHEDDAPIYESLAMTEELRDALFPKTPRMVSAIFDRPPPLGRQPAATPEQPPGERPAGGGPAFPIIF
jgi:hypothetical protein